MFGSLRMEAAITLLAGQLRRGDGRTRIGVMEAN
jgi:hypothetical protein